jgi:integrase/recombinase XerD
VSAYSEEKIRQLMAAADQEEYELFQFFLCTGSREQEVQYATWRDVDFSQKTFAITEKLDLGFVSKDKEEGIIPIPDSLVEFLQARRKRYPQTRLIFPGSSGKPNGHLFILKRLALRAGLNCGHCYNKQGKCCAEHPVCDRWELHRWRKTYATMHHEAGVPVRTIQRWLRHIRRVGRAVCRSGITAWISCHASDRAFPIMPSSRWTRIRDLPTANGLKLSSSAERT